MMEMMLGQYRWKYELTVPGKIIFSNAEPSDIDKSADTVSRTFSTAALSNM